LPNAQFLIPYTAEGIFHASSWDFVILCRRAFSLFHIVHIGGRVEIGEVYFPSQLECTQQLCT
jgi:hypothetical protein